MRNCMLELHQIQSRAPSQCRLQRESGVSAWAFIHRGSSACSSSSHGHGLLTVLFLITELSDAAYL